jgi:hypothetical protein
VIVRRRAAFGQLLSLDMVGFEVCRHSIRPPEASSKCAPKNSSTKGVCARMRAIDVLTPSGMTSWRPDRNSRPKRLEVVQCRKAIVPNDAVPEDARNAHVPCPQAMPPLSMAGARDLHLFGGVQCK